MKYPIEGSCQCGQVQYKLYEAPKKVFACHCTECQKLATSPFSVTAIVSADRIEFSGKLKEWGRSSDSGNRNHAKFCPDCGNRIYHFNPEDLSTIKLKLKPVNLQDASVFEPEAHIWVSEKVNWYQIPEGVKSYPKQP
ncbi:TPA: GFA family protein [Vibrio parahaemolyticus]|nr:GFA family protein [Vibrio parahaemolyticus]HBH7862219.1 GFA family protein [Vibrio parahaemolyticus]HBH7904684.1 GFA family protein [Vibrio parahaemolyticus]